MASNNNSRDIVFDVAMEGGRINHGGLRGSIHNTPNCATTFGNNRRPRPAAPTRMRHGNHHSFGVTQTRSPYANNGQAHYLPPVSDAAHAQSPYTSPTAQLQSPYFNGGGYSQSPYAISGTTRAYGPYTNVDYAGPMNDGMAVNPPENHHDEQVQTQELLRNFLVQPQNITQIRTVGNFYTLGLHDRNELWHSIQLKTPRIPNSQSWAMPFPDSLNLMELLVRGYNEASLYLDERYVRLVLRTLHDAQGNEVAKDLLLTPPHASIDLRDPRFRNAMADAWWKLNRWMIRVMHGETVSLLQHLKNELEEELEDKKERVY
ncbi:hypothetical protein PG993_007914 [Apiospora rasikravindrae]|uniref:Uncharacterized protein n=1 Tax=Apiospora rasikravindrae TaxID=990691 RepID=A0ABR1SYU7_9PEZI